MGSQSASKTITLRLFELREQEVILDRDLAALYGIPTKRLNLYVKRHATRFPPDFAFHVTAEEWRDIKLRMPPRKGSGGHAYRPHAFTEQGVMMVASVLRGRRAVAISIEILRAFARARTGTFGELNRLASTPLQLPGEEPRVVTYFIQAGAKGLIKIGITTDFQSRLRSLQTSSPVPLRLLGVVPEDIEDYCHVALWEWRVRGEWFKPVTEVLAFIEEQLPPERNIN
jgi:hypothetical protein